MKQEEPKQIKCYCGHTITCDCEPKQETLAARYIILEESCSGHCCFEYTVIDTHIEHDVTWKRSMCETFDKDKAETICNALNRL
jgi:hypothetical protein